MARDVKLLQQTLEVNFKRFMNFLGFARGFILRKNPLKHLKKNLTTLLKECLTIHKKLKMAQYRLNYHRHQLHKMESLIAENNEHTFLRGKNLNQVR